MRAQTSCAPASDTTHLLPGWEIEIALNTSDKELQLKMAALAAVPDPIFILTESGRYAAIIGGPDRSMYHDGSCLVDFSLYDVLPEAKADWFADQIRRTLAADTLRIVEYALAGTDVDGLDADAGPDGEIWFEGRIQPLGMRVNDERAVVWLASNISRRHALENQLRKLSETDELTGIGNRRRLVEALGQLLADYHPATSSIALLMIDIDHFKTVNDRYGHLEGDHIIRELAQICDARIKQADVFARLGGEEFALVLNDSTAEQAMRVAQRLRRAVADHEFKLACGATLNITVSIGVSVACATARRSNDLLRLADSALYSAKHQGRDRAFLATEPRPAPPTNQA